MKRLSLWFLIFSLFGLVLLQSKQAAQENPLVVLHVTVIDGTGAEAAPDQTVVIKGDRITALGKAGEVSIPNGATAVDGTGKVSGSTHRPSRPCKAARGRRTIVG